jgi:hypothetical protein
MSGRRSDRSNLAGGVRPVPRQKRLQVSPPTKTLPARDHVVLPKGALRSATGLDPNAKRLTLGANLLTDSGGPLVDPDSAFQPLKMPANETVDAAVSTSGSVKDFYPAGKPNGVPLRQLAEIIKAANGRSELRHPEAPESNHTGRLPAESSDSYGHVKDSYGHVKLAQGPGPDQAPPPQATGTPPKADLAFLRRPAARRQPKDLLSRRRGILWLSFARIGLVLLVAAVIGLMVTPWQNGRPLALDSTAAHLMAARHQAWTYENRFNAIVAEEQANPGSVPVLDHTLSDLAALSASVQRWSPPPPVSSMVAVFARQFAAAKTYFTMIADADRFGGVSYSGLSQARLDLTLQRRATLAALMQVAPERS